MLFIFTRRSNHSHWVTQTIAKQKLLIENAVSLTLHACTVWRNADMFMLGSDTFRTICAYLSVKKNYFSKILKNCYTEVALPGHILFNDFTVCSVVAVLDKHVMFKIREVGRDFEYINFEVLKHTGLQAAK